LDYVKQEYVGIMRKGKVKSIQKSAGDLKGRFMEISKMEVRNQKTKSESSLYFKNIHLLKGKCFIRLLSANITTMKLK
jgi:hypothetical protein